MQLSRRLQSVVALVSEGYRVAEIGCDHAYSSIFLVRNKISPFCIAMDIHRGPLQIAQKNIKKYNCIGQIETRLSDGAKQLDKEEVDTILIAGMGGALINKILLESQAVIKTAKELILQPQSEVAQVRRNIHQFGFQIIEEKMLREGEKDYIIIKAVPGIETYSEEIFYQFGKLLLENKNPFLFMFLQYGLKKYQNVLAQLENCTKNENKRKKEIEQKLDYIRKGIKFYEM